MIKIGELKERDSTEVPFIAKDKLRHRRQVVARSDKAVIRKPRRDNGEAVYGETDGCNTNKLWLCWFSSECRVLSDPAEFCFVRISLASTDTVDVAIHTHTHTVQGNKGLRGARSICFQLGCVLFLSVPARRIQFQDVLLMKLKPKHVF